MEILEILIKKTIEKNGFLLGYLRNIHYLRKHEKPLKSILYEKIYSLFSCIVDKCCRSYGTD